MDPHVNSPMTVAGATPGQARGALVLLHGRGGSASDILGLGALVAREDMTLVAPQAAGQSWWPTSFLAPEAEIGPWRDSALAAVERCFIMLADNGLSADRVALCGFSQGACLALEYAARAGKAPRAVIALSGGLLGTGDAEGPAEAALYGHRPKTFDYATDRAGLSLYLGCHAQDPHIPLARVQGSASVFGRLGADVTVDIYPGAGHGVLPQGVDALRQRVVLTG